MKNLYSIFETNCYEMEKKTIEEKFKAYLSRSGLLSKDYQVRGVEWCVEHEVKGFDLLPLLLTPTTNKKVIRGGIMADEMGLGKTIQMLGLMVCNFQRQTLIVLPKALLDQWVSAIKKTLGHKPLVYHHVSKKNKLSVDEKLKTSPIVLTTYGMIALSKKKKVLSALHKIAWNRLIFDEAHHLRNSSTSEYAGAMELKTQITWLVTGTPIQNKVKDLYSLMDILKVPAAYYQNEEILADLANHLIIHRTKVEVGIILPAVSYDSKQIEWSNKVEKKIAQSFHRGIEACMLVDLNGGGDEGDREEEEEEGLGEGGEDSILLKILRARQTCILAALMHANQLQTRLETDNAVDKINSCKMKAVIEKIVERKENGKNKLVFCHFRGEIDYLKAMLTNTENDMAVQVIDGRTKTRERRKILEQKKEEAEASSTQILILQIQTGCEGLNLQMYSEVYFVSPHWNPAVEEQAIARCHRIGQTQETDVFRFYMNGFDGEAKTRSLDQYVSVVQLNKREIAHKILW